MAKTHYRIHLLNDVTWCGRRISWGRSTPLANVVTVSEEAFRLMSVRYLDNGRVDYTPLTPAERAIIQADRDRVKRLVTCRSCRNKFGWD